MGKLLYAFICIIHADSNSSRSLKFVDLHPLLSSVVSSKHNLKSSWLIDCEICGFVLISKSMSTDDNWLFPAWNEPWDIFNDDGLSKDSSIEYVPDGAIRAFPHFLELKLFNSGLIRGNGGTLNTYLALLNGLSRLNSNFVISGISMLDAQVEIQDL